LGGRCNLYLVLGDFYKKKKRKNLSVGEMIENEIVMHQRGIETTMV
jgi:hypothetical protein